MCYEIDLPILVYIKNFFLEYFSDAEDTYPPKPYQQLNEDITPSFL